jgi:hypothetical protein
MKVKPGIASRASSCLVHYFLNGLYIVNAKIEKIILTVKTTINIILLKFVVINLLTNYSRAILKYLNDI